MTIRFSATTVAALGLAFVLHVDQAIGDETNALDPIAEKTVIAEPTGEITESFYQDIEVMRRPSFDVQGFKINQQIHYRIRSLFTVRAPDDNDIRTVTQEIRSTELVAADRLSQTVYPGSLAKLKGRKLRYKVNATGSVIQFSGYVDTRQNTTVATPAAAGGMLAGAMVSDVIDEDGWRELVQLTLFRPEKVSKNGDVPSRRMRHDWGDLGEWYGETRFTQQRRRGKLQQISYVHQMRYNKPAAEDSSGPFKIKDADFSTYRADGAIQYDTRAKQVTAVREQFTVSGTVDTELLGSPVTIGVREEQVITINVLTDAREFRLRKTK